MRKTSFRYSQTSSCSRQLIICRSRRHFEKGFGRRLGLLWEITVNKAKPRVQRVAKDTIRRLYLETLYDSPYSENIAPSPIFYSWYNHHRGIIRQWGRLPVGTCRLLHVQDNWFSVAVKVFWKRFRTPIRITLRINVKQSQASFTESCQT